MLRRWLTVLGLTGVAAGGAVATSASTFDRKPIAPAYGVDVVHRGVTQAQLGRQLFSNPYATVTIGHVDLYGVFPYVEARHFQIVSDPAWNRLVYGELGKSLRAHDGRGDALGALKEPRGLAVDEQNRLYVADAGNDRVVVYQTVTEFDRMDLVPLYAIGGLAHPYDVAHSDGGTPFDAADDRLYVADTGANRVVAFALEPGAARRVADLGSLGSGPGKFAGPMAIAVGRNGGVNTNDVYVADAHSQRLVRLVDQGGGRLVWADHHALEADVVTALDTDQWGNVYAAAPNRGTVQKLAPDLTPVAELRTDVSRPRSFHVPFVSVRDHRTGTTAKRGMPNGVSIEDWTETGGVKLWSLGVELADLAIVSGGDDPAAAGPSARFTLTDRAAVTLEVSDLANGRRIARRSVGTLAAGVQRIGLTAAETGGAAGAHERLVRVIAVADYEGGETDVAQATFTTDVSGAILPPAHAVLLGNHPNPAMGATRIALLLPDSDVVGARLRILDARGRVIRTLEQRFTPGLSEVLWDGCDGRGRDVPAGIYFSQLHAGGKSFTHKMVFVR